MSWFGTLLSSRIHHFHSTNAFTSRHLRQQERVSARPQRDLPGVTVRSNSSPAAHLHRISSSLQWFSQTRWLGTTTRRRRQREGDGPKRRHARMTFFVTSPSGCYVHHHLSLSLSFESRRHAARRNNARRPYSRRE